MPLLWNQSVSFQFSTNELNRMVSILFDIALIMIWILLCKKVVLPAYLEFNADFNNPVDGIRYGNTSSSTVWYSLGYIESCQGVKKGEIVWQVGFGSGFKCNSSVWRAMKNVKVTHKAWAHLSGT